MKNAPLITTVIAVVLANGLCGCGWPDHTEVWIARLKHDDLYVRREAAKALGERGDARAVEPLIAALRNDGVSYVREEAAEALGKIGDARAVEPLIAALKHDNSYDSSGVQWRAGEALVKIGEPAVEPLMAALKDGDFDVRWRAAEALGKIGEPAVEPLIAAHKAGDSDVRWQAARALAMTGDARALEPLIDALKEGPSPEVAEALGKIGDARAVEPLIAPLKDGDSDVRAEAAEALGKIGDARAVEPLIAAHKDAQEDDYSVLRSLAAEALAKIGDARAVPTLVDALTDRRCNSTVAKSLRKLGWQPNSKTDRIHFLVAQRDAGALKAAKNWPDVKQVLLQDVRSGDRRRLEFALEAFTGIGKDDVLPDLLRFMRMRGGKTIAEAYLNCNHEKLREAAEAWAREHGYIITSGYGASQTWNWGSW